MAASWRGPVLALLRGLSRFGASAMGTLNPYFTQKSILPPGSGGIAGIGGMGTATLLTKRMYAITAGVEMKSAGGDSVWTNIGYYTLNSITPRPA